MKSSITRSVIAIIAGIAAMLTFCTAAFAENPAAVLASLTVEGGTLSTQFDPNVREYTVYADSPEVIINASMSAVVEEVPVSTMGETEIVLLFDKSESMGAAFADAKLAAKSFCQSLLEGNPNAKASVVFICSSPYVGCQLTNDYSVLEAALNAASCSGGTNITSAISLATQMLEHGGENAFKGIVLMTDGLPVMGASSSSGPFAPYSPQSNWNISYNYCNGLYNTIQALPEQYHVFTMGFLHAFVSYPNDYAYASNVLQLCQNSGYFESTDIETLIESFQQVLVEIIEHTGLITVQVDDAESYSCTEPIVVEANDRGIRTVTLTTSIYNCETSVYEITVVWVPENIILGDVDGNGIVDSVDCLLLSRYCMGSIPMTNRILYAGDVNGDGEYTLVDVRLILLYAMRMTSSL